MLSFSSCLVDYRTICGLIPVTGTASWRPGFNSWHGQNIFFFPQSPDRLCGPPSLCSMSTGDKCPECETDRLTICFRGYDKHREGPLLYICVRAHTTDKRLRRFCMAKVRTGQSEYRHCSSFCVSPRIFFSLTNIC
jgi:hypothetical protein